MLEQEKIGQEDAIEQHVCIPFEKAKRHEMSQEQAGVLMKLLMGDAGFKVPEKEWPFLMQVIDKRVRGCFDYKITDQRLLLFLAMIAESPGTAVMYTTYLQYYCNKRNRKEIDLKEFCNIFPIGFPSKEDLQKIWDGQKVKRLGHGGSDNLLDYASARISIHTKQEHGKEKEEADMSEL